MADKGIDIALLKRGAKKISEAVGSRAIRAGVATKFGAAKAAEVGSAFVENARPQATVLGGALVNNGLRAAMGLPLDKASMAAAAGAAVQAAMGGGADPEPAPEPERESPPSPTGVRGPVIDAEYTVED